MENLLFGLSVENISNTANVLQLFFNICVSTLHSFTARKKKYSRRSNIPLMNKTLKKALIKRSCLQNFYLKWRSVEKKIAYNWQTQLPLISYQKYEKVILSQNK